MTKVAWGWISALGLLAYGVLMFVIGDVFIVVGVLSFLMAILVSPYFLRILLRKYIQKAHQKGIAVNYNEEYYAWWNIYLPTFFVLGFTIFAAYQSISSDTPPDQTVKVEVQQSPETEEPKQQEGQIVRRDKVSFPPFPTNPVNFQYNKIDTDMKINRLWATVSIIAPEAKTLEQRVATAMLAAYDVHFKQNAKTIYVFLDTSKENSGRGMHLARVVLTVEGCGIAGDQCDGVYWRADATAEQQNADGSWPDTIIFRDDVDFEQYLQISDEDMTSIRTILRNH